MGKISEQVWGDSGERHHRKVQRDGIHMFGLRYFSITLAAFVSESVTIRYDPRDLAEIRVYHHGVFVCRAVSPEIAASSIPMEDLEAARNQRRRELRQHLTARRSLAELLTSPEPSPPTAEPVPAPRASGAPEPARIKIYRED